MRSRNFVVMLPQQQKQAIWDLLIASFSTGVHQNCSIRQTGLQLWACIPMWLQYSVALCRHTQDTISLTQL